jgi:hypothetical protein
MIVERFYPRYSDGTPLVPGDELEVSYTELLDILHRGLVYRLVAGVFGTTEVWIIHNSKRDAGVCVVSWAEFAQGQMVRLRRRPSSAAQARQILQRGEGLLGHPYHPRDANCEQFTDFCYTGVQGRSETVSTLAALVSVGVVGIGLFALAQDRPRPRRR